MIKKLSLISVFILLFCTVSASAQDAGNNSANSSNALDQRVTERLKTLKSTLNDNQLRVIKARCKAAQDKIKAIKKVGAVYSVAQNERVDNILNNLNALSGNLRSQGVDTTEIDNEIEKIKQLQTKIDTAYEDYLLAIDDSSVINCQESPEGFRLSVDDAKQQFAQLRELRNSLRQIVKDDLRQTLINLKDSL